MYRRMNLAGVAGRGAAPSFIEQRKRALQADPAVVAALRNLTRFDRELYDEAAARFAKAVDAQPPAFRRALRDFRAATRDEREGTRRGARGPSYQWVGGAPPEDRFMVTVERRYLCKASVMARKGQLGDYGSCDVRLGKPADRAAGRPAGPQRFDELKTLVPCELANCSKIAADRMSCWHRQPRLPTCLDIESAPDGFM